MRLLGGLKLAYTSPVVIPLGEAATPATLASDEFLLCTEEMFIKKPARSPVFLWCAPRRSRAMFTGSPARFIHLSASRETPPNGAFCVVVIRSGSGDFFDGRFQQGDTLFDAVDFQIFFVAVEAGANRAKAVQRGDTVGRGDVGV